MTDINEVRLSIRGRSAARVATALSCVIALTACASQEAPGGAEKADGVAADFTAAAETACTQMGKAADHHRVIQLSAPDGALAEAINDSRAEAASTTWIQDICPFFLGSAEELAPLDSAALVDSGLFSVEQLALIATRNRLTLQDDRCPFEDDRALGYAIGKARIVRDLCENSAL